MQVCQEWQGECGHSLTGQEKSPGTWCSEASLWLDKHKAGKELGTGGEEPAIAQAMQKAV
jgi:hypothetical protein